MIFLFFYLLFAAAAGYIWFQIFKLWSKENAEEKQKQVNYRRTYMEGPTAKPATPAYRYDVKPIYILGFIVLTLLSVIGMIAGIWCAHEEEIDIVNLKIK